MKGDSLSHSRSSRRTICFLGPFPVGVKFKRTRFRRVEFNKFDLVRIVIGTLTLRGQTIT